MTITHAAARKAPLHLPSFLPPALAAVALTGAFLFAPPSLADAQDRASAGDGPPVAVLCLEHLNAGQTLDIARSIIGTTARVDFDSQTNCLLVIGLADAPALRRTLATLEARAAHRSPAQRAATRRRSRSASGPT